MTTNKAADSAGGQTAYLVLGMHRSGTSALTQVLAAAGADLPRNVMGGDEHNERGYFEPWTIAVFNDGLLRAAGSAWDDVFAFPLQPLARREERGWLERATTLFDQEYGLAQWPLLKDPRISVLAPFWRTVLEDLKVRVRCVVAVRHPLAVAGSLARRNGFPKEKSLLLWTAYMLAAETYTRDLPRAFVGYDALIADWRGEVARIEAAHGAPLPHLDAAGAEEIDRFLAPELRHNGGTGELSELGWAGALSGAVYGWFEAAARDEDRDPAALEESARELRRRRSEIGPLVSPAARDLDAARSEAYELRQRLEIETARRRALESQVEDLQRERAQVEAILDAALAVA